MATKLNPGAFDCYRKVQADEPYFVLRAKDVTAPGVVREWVRRRREEAAVTGGTITPLYEQKLREAEACADDMDAWRAAHPELHDQHDLRRTHVPGETPESARRAKDGAGS
jgi:hypothetical protein